MTYEQQEIDLINRIVAEAIWHGADSGGAYYQNTGNLINSLNDWISYRLLRNAFDVHSIEVKLSNGLILKNIPQIIKK